MNETIMVDGVVFKTDEHGSFYYTNKRVKDKFTLDNGVDISLTTIEWDLKNGTKIYIYKQ